MWSRKMSKLSVFLLLMVLVNISRGETTVESLTKTSDAQPQELNGDAIIAEHLNSAKDTGVKVSAIAVDEVSVASEPSTELENNTATESVTNAEDVNNTESPSNATPSTEPITETTTKKQIECVCDCIANGNQVTLGCTTESPEKTTENSSNNDSTLPNAETTQSTETATDSINAETTSEPTLEVDTTTQSAGEPETTTVLPPPICSTPGVKAHELDCQHYYDCSLEESLDGSFHLLTKSCPEKQTFNTELNRCSRDISSCLSLPIQCLVKGGVADPASNSSYYLCEPRLIGVGFRIFHIDCASNEIFYPELGKCFLDFNNIPTQSMPPFNWNQIRDIDIVKAEIKLLKEQDKLKLKQEKDRQKAEEKLQKEFEKEAKKKAKEEGKANKEKAKQQATSIVCLKEGNYASEIGENIYYSCITKKGKLKAIPMQCSFGATFNAEMGACINSLTGVNSSASEGDD